MRLLLWFSIGVFAYVYIGYPLILRAIVRLRGVRDVRRRDITPPVSLVISAYNEAAVIRQKLDNALAIDYPKGQIEIVVVSDASDDATDAIVETYADRGVRLARQPVRRGKTAGLNRTVPSLRGEIVVFSDANAMYEPDAIRRLVRNFADPDVGCVTGEARYVQGNRSAADVGERAYWTYEIQIKRLETAVGSMVGGDGAIYGIRKHLWRELPGDAINDFLNPLQIVAAGWRAVYEPSAVCREDTAGGVRLEYRRRVRIVSRSVRAITLVPGLLNPFRSGYFAIALLSHKVLRWLSGLMIAMAAVSLVVSLVSASSGVWLASTGTVSWLAAVWVASPSARRFLAFSGYFMAISAASLVGVGNGLAGRVSGVWLTPRQPKEGVLASGTIRPVAWVSMLLLTCLPLLALVTFAPGVPRAVSAALLWGSIAALGYVYVGYPATLYLVRPLLARPVRRGSVQQSVCLFITANDEEDVMDAKLRNSLQLDYPRDLLDIVVASDGSVDRTNEIVRSFAEQGVKLLDFRTRRGKIAAINAGLPVVTSDIIVFSDANTFLQPGAIKALVRNFADERVGAVSGDVVLVGDRAALGPSEDLYYRYERWLQDAESRIGSMVGVDGALYAVRRSLVVSPPEDTVLDDVAIPMAVVGAGYRVVFEPDARAFEPGPRTAIEEFRRRVRISAGGVQYLIRADSEIPTQHVQVMFALIVHKALRWLTSTFMSVLFLSALRVGLSSHLVTAVVVAQVGVVLLGTAGCAQSLRRWWPVGLVHYLCLVQTAAAIGLIRGLRNRQSVAWERFRRAPVETA